MNQRLESLIRSSWGPIIVLTALLLILCLVYDARAEMPSIDYNPKPLVVKEAAKLSPGCLGMRMPEVLKLKEVWNCGQSNTCETYGMDGQYSYWTKVWSDTEGQVISISHTENGVKTIMCEKRTSL